MKIQEAKQAGSGDPLADDDDDDKLDKLSSIVSTESVEAESTESLAGSCSSTRRKGP